MGLQVSHLFFNRLEPSGLLPLILLLVIVPAVPSVLLLTHFTKLWLSAAVAYTTYYTVLFLSIIVYRISPFHPLASYPGPFIDKISKFRAVWITSSGKQHVYFKKMHEKYGPYVRVGESFCTSVLIFT